MKHITKILILILAALLLGGLLAACTPDMPPVDGEHVHEYKNWKHNSYNHWQECDCGANLNYGEHSGGMATYDSKPICDVCGVEYGTHIHQYGEWKSNSHDHWKECTCGVTAHKQRHTGGSPTYESGAICEVCGQEYGEHLHQFDATGYDDTYHWKECACGQKSGKERHSGVGVGIIGDPRRVCEECGNEYTVHVHQGQGEWLTSESHHWKMCDCGQTANLGQHSFDGSSAKVICEVCGYESSHVHHADDKEWQSDLNEHWKVCSCGEQFNISAHQSSADIKLGRAPCEICNTEFEIIAIPDIEGIVRGNGWKVNDYSYIVAPFAPGDDAFWSIRAEVELRVRTIYSPQYWVNYLQQNGYPQVERVEQSEPQLICFVIEDTIIYSFPVYDVKYIAYDKDGNIVTLPENDGVDPVEKMLREKICVEYYYGTGERVHVDLRMDGSTSTIPLEVAFRMGYYGETKADAEEKVKHNTTYGSYYNLRDGKCDLIFTTPLSAEQREEAKNRGLDLAEVPICMEAFVFVVNANNPVEELTVQQLKDIYSGKITNWKEVGGPDAAIEAFQRNETSGSQNYMKLFMGDTPLMEPNTYMTPHDMHGLVEVLASYDNAINSIGYSVYSYAANMYVDAGKIKFIKVNGIGPTEETMSDLTYPLLNYNYAVYDKNNDNPEIEKMVNWILSNEGQQAVIEGGYVPVGGGKLPEYVDSNEVKLYDAIGTGKKTSDAINNGTASTLEMAMSFFNVEMPENYLSESRYFYDQYGFDYPIVYGIKYSIEGLLDKDLEKEINDFIASACAEVETKFEEVYDMFLYYTKNEKMYFNRFFLADTYSTLDGVSTKIVRPSKVEVKGKNNYLSVIVHTGFATSADDIDIYYRYYTKTATFDLRTGERVEKLSDMFPEGVDFIEALNDSVRYDIDTKTKNYYGNLYIVDGEFMALTEADVENFTCDSVIFPFGSSVAELGFEANFYADALSTGYCDIRQFLSEDFRAWIRTVSDAQPLSAEEFFPVSGSDTSGVYYPTNAGPALVKAAQTLADHLNQLLDKDAILKAYHDAGYTDIVRVEFSFLPTYLPYKVGDVFYLFNQHDIVWDQIFFAYDADGKEIFKDVIDMDELYKEVTKDVYFSQSTGNPIRVTLKEGWEEVATVWSLTDGQEWSYLELADKIEVKEDEIDLFTGRFSTRVYLDKLHTLYVIIPEDYIILE